MKDKLFYLSTYFAILPDLTLWPARIRKETQKALGQWMAQALWNSIRQVQMKMKMYEINGNIRGLKETNAPYNSLFLA